MPGGLGGAAGTSSRRALVALPMDDFATNTLMVNAAQRHASVVVQKSLQEGFGLTVTEAMWKSRPVLASAVGGIVDQVPAQAGVLLEDPSDLESSAAPCSRCSQSPASWQPWDDGVAATSASTSSATAT